MVHPKGFKKSGAGKRLRAILRIDRITDYVKIQKKAIADKFSAAAFFLSYWSSKVILIIILVLFLPYIITMCCRGVSNSGTVRQQIYQYKDCPVLKIEDSHGTLYLPIEIYLKGVLGGHIYVNSMETKSKYRENGELIMLDNDSLFIEKKNNSAVSTNNTASYQINEAQLKELAIRYRSRIYYIYCNENINSDENYASDDEENSNEDNNLEERNDLEENYNIEEREDLELSYYYFTDTELRQLFGANWDMIAEQLSDCIRDTWGKVYGKDGEVVYVPLEGEVGEQLYSAW